MSAEVHGVLRMRISRFAHSLDDRTRAYGLVEETFALIRRFSIGRLSGATGWKDVALDQETPP